MTNPHMGLEQIVVQAEGNIVSDMGSEKVMMSVSSGKYYNLGEVGGRIWEHMASPITVRQLVDLLTAEYDIERTACEGQIAAFLDNLYKEQLIQALDGVVPKI
jgi:hypothetical protein